MDFKLMFLLSTDVLTLALLAKFGGFYTFLGGIIGCVIFYVGYFLW